MKMTKKERLLTAMRAGGIPDRVPCTPDFSNYIPCRRTGLPFWKIYFENEIPLWKAYVDTADYFGIESWMASCMSAPLTFENANVEWHRELVFDKHLDAMIAKIRVKTPDGELTRQSLCYRADPPSPIEKFIKDFAVDFKKYKWMQVPPTAVDMTAFEEMRTAAHSREQAFGVGMSYPGFQSWFYAVEGGVEPLAIAEYETPEILEEWYALDLANGTRTMELLIAAKPDYIGFGGSGTVTLASPQLAMKYAIPALKKWSAMAKAAGIPTMLHSCGKSRAFVDMLCDHTDVNCINPLEIPPMGDIDLAELKRTRGHQISLMGNLHTTNVMLRGTPADVKRAARQAIEDAGQGGGFILSTGDQCPRDTPDENLFAMVEAAEEYGKY